MKEKRDEDSPMGGGHDGVPVTPAEAAKEMGAARGCKGLRWRSLMLLRFVGEREEATGDANVGGATQVLEVSGRSEGALVRRPGGSAWCTVGGVLDQEKGWLGLGESRALERVRGGDGIASGCASVVGRVDASGSGGVR